jgi:hypothetical protein
MTVEAMLLQDGPNIAFERESVVRRGNDVSNLQHHKQTSEQ